MVNIESSIFVFQEYLFLIFIFLSYLLTAISIFKLSDKAEEYLYVLDYYAKIYICLFLIIRFNPLIQIKFTNHDRRVAFSSGLFLLSTSALNNILIKIKSFKF